MRNIIILLLVVNLLFSNSNALALSSTDLENIIKEKGEKGLKYGEDIIKSSDLTIPSSPGFFLLDVTPTKVYNPGFKKDFKLDWFINSNGQLAPSAMEFKPYWLLYGDKLSLADYRDSSKMNDFKRNLTTFSVSTASVQKDASTTAMSIGFSMTVWREFDPIKDIQYPTFSKDTPEMDNILIQSTSYESLIHKEQAKQPIDQVKILEYQNQIKLLEAQINEYSEKEKSIVIEARKKYEEQHWNSAKIDIGGGWLWNSQGTFTMNNISLVGTGNGIWLSGQTSLMGENDLITGMIKTTSLSGINITSYGLNLRYGNNVGNLFLEGVGENISNNNSSTIVSTGVKYRYSQDILVEGGLRWEYINGASIPQTKTMLNISWLGN